VEDIILVALATNVEWSDFKTKLKSNGVCDLLDQLLKHLM